MSHMLQQLSEALGDEYVLTDADTLALFSQDVYEIGPTAAAVIRPDSTKEVARAVAITVGAGKAVVARGGGMSYTGAYIAAEPGSVLVDLSRMNHILEINQQDMYVTAQAGVTWKQLHDALEPLGLRTPFWGTLSGIHATVGGGASQNCAFWGSGRFGAGVDSIIGLEVVLANGEVLNTGAGGQRNSQPFFRHFGPDLTGLFCGDTGALGVKTAVTLKLMPAYSERRYLSFEFDDYPTMLNTMSAIARSGRATEVFGFDPYLQSQRLQRESIAKDLQQLKGVMQSSGSVLKGLKEGAKVALAGRRYMKNVRYSAHVSLEEHSTAAADESRDHIRHVAIQHGAKEIENSLPKINRANPFMPVNSMIGPLGERWAPVHGLVAHSKLESTFAAVQALFESESENMEKHNVQHGALIATVDTNMVIVEPVLYWHDALTEIHRHYVDDAVLSHIEGFEENLAARDYVAGLRRKLTSLFREQGAVHFQIGKAYQYLEGIEAPNVQLIKAIKQVVDPDNRINPGSLGL